jgi:glycosyltransferase involved in cell wall biosynthesis
LPTIDIALPFYGDVGYLKLAVNSILAQSDQDWRLIVSDDGYPDPEVETWFKSLADSRIHYSRNALNLGANGNFQKCLELVTADYFVVMGADDVMHPKYVEVMRSVISSNPAPKFFQPEVRIIDSNGKVIAPLADRIKSKLRPRPGTYSGEDACATLMKGNWLYFPAVLWSTHEVKSIGFRKGLNVAQDLALAVDILMRGHEFTVVDKTLLDYRRHPGGDSAVRALSGDRFIEERKFFTGLAKEFKTLNWRSAEKSARVHITSRLNAASLLPVSLIKRKGTKELIKHVIL